MVHWPNVHLGMCVSEEQRTDILALSQVGRIIDLTNTWRYYNRDEIDKLGVEHLKVIACCLLHA